MNMLPPTEDSSSSWRLQALGADVTDIPVPESPPLHGRAAAVFVRSADAGSNGWRAFVYGDLDDGARTVASDAPDVLALADALEARLLREADARPETVLPTASVTAATVAAVTEAARIRPRLDAIAAVHCGQGKRREHGVRRFRLPKPELRLSTPIGIALDQRRSSRKLGPLEPSALSTLLFHAARVRTLWTAEDGYTASSRAAPSAGARHPIDIVVVKGSAQSHFAPPGYQTQAFLFDPFTCELVCLEDAEEAAFWGVSQRAAGLLGAEPPLVIAFRGRLERTSSRYRGGLSLVYRDAGGLIAMFGVVSAGLGLGCCPLAATSPEGSFDISVLTSDSEGLDLGGVAIGTVIE